MVLQNALIHVILKEGLEDRDYINANTNGFDELAKEVENYDPCTAAKICGIDEDTIRTVARLYAKADRAMSIWTMGINQSTHGSDGVVGINNLNLVTGNIGKPGGTSLSITGQCNAMGTREWSSCSGLPGYRAVGKSRRSAKKSHNFWGIDPEFFPKQRGLTETDIFPAIETGEIKGLWLIATNPMTSMANTARIRKTLEKLECLVVQDSYVDVETTQYAHIFLPAGTWAEKEGVFTNTERRVNLTRQVQQPHADSKSDMQIFNELAKRFEQGQKISFPEQPEQVFEEMKTLSKGRLCDISGMTHDLIEQQRGIQWPYTEAQAQQGDKGTQRLYTEPATFRYADGRAKLIPLPFINNNEVPDEQFPVLVEFRSSGGTLAYPHQNRKDR